ncbi:MAG: hypothetical protein CM15mP86_18820 [Gammaproteobacteria bacterium]|nr:MAG: hypothetical protein CM15mP86_18820 [Gammaproteobacteria bacterium]
MPYHGVNVISKVSNGNLGWATLFQSKNGFEIYKTEIFGQSFGIEGLKSLRRNKLINANPYGNGTSIFTLRQLQKNTA